MHQCIKCNILKTKEDFYKNNLSKNGLNPWCKSCVKKYQKDNKEKISIQRKVRHKLQPWRKTFHGIKNRCNNTNYRQFKDYGGRGIKCLITMKETLV